MNPKTANIENNLNGSREQGLFTPDNIRQCEQTVLKVQHQLDKVVEDDDRNKIRFLVHQLSMKSSAVKILAIDRICQTNTGKYTGGVDEISTPRNREERHEFMTDLYHNLDITKDPDPIRRVFIPKPNGKQRPLGIPTIADRIIQEIIRQSIEPICEYHFHDCSHGFRPKRSCHDAISSIFQKLSRKRSPRWIVEGDIKGCFDHISHDHILDTLKAWKVPNQINNLILNILKAGISFDGNISSTIEGTPQGGVISPLLANVALTCLDDMIFQRYGDKYQDYNPTVRYADDFLIIAQDESQANEIKEVVKQYLGDKIGLELSDEKTRITSITDGFNFLGFNVRKYGNQDKLIMKPTEDNSKDFRYKIKQITKNQNLDTHGLIKTLNPVIRGWGNYYRHVASSEAYGDNDKYLYMRYNKWLYNTFPKSSGKWITSKHFTDNWTFYDQQTGIKAHKMSRTPRRRYIKVQNHRRVYNKDDQEYWNERESNQIALYGQYKALYHKQHGKCAYCDRLFKSIDENFNLHHLKPIKFGGKMSQNNLRLIHQECHSAIHSELSLEEMSNYADKGINYLRLMKGNNITFA